MAALDSRGITAYHEIPSALAVRVTVCAAHLAPRTVKESPVPLTAINCTKATAKEAPYKLADSGGMYLLVKESGKYWRFDYRHLGKRKTLALGVFPEVSLAEARLAHAAARKALRDGVDPGEQRAEQKAKALGDAANSFKALALAWHAHKAKTWSESTATKTLRQLEQHLFPKLGVRPAASIKPPELLKALRAIPVAYTATRMREVAGQVFRFGIQEGKLESDPTRDLRDALSVPAVQHRPALTSRREFGAFLCDLRDFKSADRITLLATRLALLTFVRSQELRLGLWSEIDFEAREWRIPAGRMKAGKGLSQAHIVPLSAQALDALSELQQLTGHSPFLFPNVTGEKDFMSENTMGRMLWRLGYKGRQTLHGFRASARSILSEGGEWTVAAMERQLDHAERNKVVAAYARSEHLAERRRMMDAWGAMVAEMESGGNVVPIARTA